MAKTRRFYHGLFNKKNLFFIFLYICIKVKTQLLRYMIAFKSLFSNKGHFVLFYSKMNVTRERLDARIQSKINRGKSTTSPPIIINASVELPVRNTSEPEIFIPNSTTMTSTISLPSPASDDAPQSATPWGWITVGIIASLCVCFLGKQINL